MIQEVEEPLKDLLIKDLCARLPHRVKLQNVNNADSIVKLYSINLDDYCYEIKYYTYEGKSLTICNIGKLLRRGKFLSYKPYLFPLSSMTDEHKKEFDQCIELELKAINDEIDPTHATAFEVDFYNKHHYDWRGLIPLGLAIDATGLSIY